MRTPLIVLVATAVLLAGVAPAGAEPPVVVTSPLPPAPNEILPPILEPLTRRYEEPPTPFTAGHRGVDIEIVAGLSELRAATHGTVDTGVVVGNRFLTIERNGNLRVTLSYISAALVLDGSSVRAGDLVARAGTGHPGSSSPTHVHLSVRIPDLIDPSGWRYVDPMPYLRRYLRRVRGPIAHAAPDPFR